MGNIQVAGALKRITTKVNMMVTISSLQGPGRGKRGSKINGSHYKKVNRAWWKKGRPREKVRDISVIWLWVANQTVHETSAITSNIHR